MTLIDEFNLDSNVLTVLDGIIVREEFENSWLDDFNSEIKRAEINESKLDLPEDIHLEAQIELYDLEYFTLKLRINDDKLVSNIASNHEYQDKIKKWLEEFIQNFNDRLNDIDLSRVPNADFIYDGGYYYIRIRRNQEEVSFDYRSLELYTQTMDIDWDMYI